MRLIKLGDGTMHVNADHIIQLRTDIVPERNLAVVTINMTGGCTLTCNLEVPGVPLQKQADDLIASIQEAARG